MRIIDDFKITFFFSLLFSFYFPFHSSGVVDTGRGGEVNSDCFAKGMGVFMDIHIWFVWRL